MCVTGSHSSTVGRTGSFWGILSSLSSLFPVLVTPAKGRISLLSTNLGSCVRNFYPAVGLSDFSDSLGFACAQETRIPPQKARRETGVGPHTWTATATQETRWNSSQKGPPPTTWWCCCIWQRELCINPLEISDEFAVGRFVHAFHCVISDFVCIVVNCYLPSGSSRKRERARSQHRSNI